MKKFLLFVCIFFLTTTLYASDISHDKQKTGNIIFSKQMFYHVFTQLDSKSVKKYFTKNAIIHLNFDKPMYTNDLINRVSMLKNSVKSIQYEYNDFIVSGNKVVVRCLVTVTTKSGKIQQRKQITIMKFQHHKISEIWELSMADDQLLKKFN